MKAKSNTRLFLLSAMLLLLTACGGEPGNDSSSDPLDSGSLSSRGMSNREVERVSYSEIMSPER
jgi:hypothetical protein